jgi:hypothetical protein
MKNTHTTKGAATATRNVEEYILTELNNALGKDPCHETVARVWSKWHAKGKLTASPEACVREYIGSMNAGKISVAV